MADLITYFFSIRFYQEAGDPTAGEKVFFEKNCNICHAQSGIARNLRPEEGGISAIRMAQFMWEHGLEMLHKMEEMRVAWPTFSGNELVDLLTYLNADAVAVDRRPERK
jgi:mono/diheme cytochrome c family protein